MVLVRRGNVELQIKDAYLKSYLAKGYNQIDESGNIISKGTPNDMNALKLAYTESQNTIVKLTKENALLEEKIKVLEAQLEYQNKQVKSKPKADK